MLYGKLEITDCITDFWFLLLSDFKQNHYTILSRSPHPVNVLVVDGKLDNNMIFSEPALCRMYIIHQCIVMVICDVCSGHLVTFRCVLQRAKKLLSVQSTVTQILLLLQHECMHCIIGC